MNRLLSDVEELISPVLAKGQIELVDVTFQNSAGGSVLCFYIDKPGGVSLNDCEKWSREIEVVLNFINF